MLEKRVKDFLQESFLDLGDFTYTFEEDNKELIVIFTEIFTKPFEKELLFKEIDNVLYFHSISYGHKDIGKGQNTKYFWIELLSEY